MTPPAVDGFAGATGAAALGGVSEAMLALGDHSSVLRRRHGLDLGVSRGRLPELVAPTVAEDLGAVVVVLGAIDGAPVGGSAAVALAAFRTHGTPFAAQLGGRFALAVRTDDRLLLVADRGGSRFPLYYRADADGVRFATTARAVAVMRAARTTLDRRVLEDLLVLGHPVPGDTLFEGIRQVPAGSQLEVIGDSAPVLRRYALPMPHVPVADCDERDPAAQYADALDASIREYATDRPAVLLSGGVDSAALVALLHEAGSERITTVTLDGADEDTSDLEAAAVVANRFGTEHHVVRYDGARLLDDLAAIVSYAELPLPHAHPQHQLFAAVRPERDTVLGGHHNDSVWGLWSSHVASPPPPGNRIATYLEIRRLCSRGMVGRLLPGAEHSDDGLIERLEAAVPVHPDPRQDPIRLDELLFSGQLADRDLGAVAAQATGLWVAQPYAAPAVAAAIQRMPIAERSARRADGSVELKGFFKGLIAERGLLPRELVYRRKTWMRSATGDLLRGPVGEQLEQLLLDDEAADRGLFDPQAVAGLLREHRTGEADHSGALVVLAGVELWQREFADPAPAG